MHTLRACLWVCVWRWPFSTSVRLDMCLCAQPSCVCELCMCCVFLPVCQVADHRRLIIRMWQKAAGSSRCALMKPGPLLIGDTMACGNESGSYQTGRKKGEDIRSGPHTAELSLFICRAHGGWKHPHSYHNPAKLFYWGQFSFFLPSLRCSQFQRANFGSLGQLKSSMAFYFLVAWFYLGLM